MPSPESKALSVETALLRGPHRVPDGYAALTVPVCRASTITFADSRAFASRSDRFLDGYTYGLAGTPTHHALKQRLALLESAAHAVLAPSGLAAVHLVNQAVLQAGDHVLLPDNVYGPTRGNATELLVRAGVEVSFYDPLTGAGIEQAIRPNTRLVWCESPGSITLEVQDVPAIAQVCRARGVLVAMDNTWASPLGFAALAHGVDLSVQALTKHVGGHSDLLMGSVATNDAAMYERLRRTANLQGANVSPDDCAMAIRGLATMSLRLEAQSHSALQIARWLRAHPRVSWLAFPPLAGDAGHSLWHRDFSGGGCVLSFSLASADWDSACDFADSLRVFQLGASFGGVNSLVAIYRGTGPRDHPRFAQLGPVLRLSVGLERTEDLIADLAGAFDATREADIERGQHAAQQT
ncbi:MAG: PLP-dependent transferase [Ideonella sp.]|nr:PLP-dependent transferase [Ideonella sp.]